MKLCLAILAISFVGFSNARTQIKCPPNQIEKIDGCVDPPPNHPPACPDICPNDVDGGPGGECKDMTFPFYFDDRESHFETKEKCGYENVLKCSALEINECFPTKFHHTPNCTERCEKRHIRDCEPERIPICAIEQVEDDCETIIEEIPKKVWELEPCLSDPTQQCMVWRKSGEIVQRPIQICRQKQVLIEDFHEYERCRPTREIDDCHLTDTAPKEYTRYECKKRIVEDCYEESEPNICEEKHTLKRRLFEHDLTIKVCKNNPNIRTAPYFYDLCDSASCRPIAKETYDNLKANEGITLVSG